MVYAVMVRRWVVDKMPSWLGRSNSSLTDRRPLVLTRANGEMHDDTGWTLKGAMNI
jgi:hypothetical protein